MALNSVDLKKQRRPFLKKLLKTGRSVGTIGAFRDVSRAGKAVQKTVSLATAILCNSATNIGKSPIKLESDLSQF